MERVVPNLPWWEYLSLREILRLSICSSKCRDIKRLFFEWASAHICHCAWKHLRERPVHKSIVAHRPKQIPYAAVKDTVCMDKRGRWYTPVRPTFDKVLHHLKTRVCRECLCETTRVAYSKQRNRVVVCKSCGFDPRCYSAMCDRRELIELNGGKRGYVALIRKLHVCKIGGNRAFLYWRADVLSLLCDKRF